MFIKVCKNIFRSPSETSSWSEFKDDESFINIYDSMNISLQKHPFERSTLWNSLFPVRLDED